MAVAKKQKKKATKIPRKKPASKKAQPAASNANARGGRSGRRGGQAETAQLPFESDQTEVDLLYPAGTIAAMLDITDRHLRRLAKEGVVPKATRGRYPLKGCVQGYIRYLQALRVSTDDRSEEATRLSRVRADTYELELQLKRSELYSREEVDAALFQVCTYLTAMLDGSASRIASQLGGGAALRGRLVDEFREIRMQFAAGLRAFSERVRKGSWDHRPATRSRARKVGKKKPGTAKRKRRARSV